MITKRHLAGGINETTGAYNDPTAVVGQTTAYDKASNKYYERALQAESRSSLYEPFDADNRPAGGYDSLDRLRQYQRGVLSSNGGCGNAGGASVTTPISLPDTDENRDYDLDGLGNWKKTTFEAVGGTEETQIRQHNSLNQITSLKDEGQPKDDLSYDLNGNLLDDGTRTYQWDALNRLKVVKRKSDGELIGEYIYDALGRRVQKTVLDGGLSGNIPDDVTRYLYHSGIAQCCEERVGTPVTKQYVWGRYIDELIQQKQAVTINGNVAGDYYPLTDTLYRTMALTNSAGAIVEVYDVDAYGNTLIFTAAGAGGDRWADDATVGDNPTCEFIFTGRRYDSETETYFYRARYYMPELGRFTGRDPSIQEGSQSNLYEYVQGSPLSFLDPSGRVALGAGVASSATAFLPVLPNGLGYGFKVEYSSQIVVSFFGGFGCTHCDTAALTFLIGAGVNLSVSAGPTGTGWLDEPINGPGTIIGTEAWLPTEGPTIEGSADILYDGLPFPENMAGITVTIPRVGVGVGLGGAIRVGATCTSCHWNPVSRNANMAACILGKQQGVAGWIRANELRFNPNKPRLQAASLKKQRRRR